MLTRHQWAIAPLTQNPNPGPSALHIGEAANDLAWLRALTYQRASMFKSANKVTPVDFYSQAQLVEKPTASELVSYKPAEFRDR